MRNLFLGFVVFFSFYAQGYSEYYTKYHTCNELRRYVQDEGTIVLNYQLFFGGKGFHHSSRKNCSPCFRPLPGNVKASDKFCTKVGYKCIKLSSEQIKKENRRRRDRGERRLDCRKPF